jgi:FkbH-like protein
LHVAVLDDVEDGNEGDIGDGAEFNALSRWTKHVTSALRMAAGRGGAVLEQLPPIDVDPYLDELAHLPTAPAVLADLGMRLAHSVWRSRTPPTKALVFDCDGTLWGGVCGELGPDGVDHSGRYRAVQRAAIEQRSAGRLLCIASHNAPDDVLAALAGDGPLGVEHLSAMRIGWRPKSEMLIELAAELDLGLDSLVFIDDSPVQRQEVRSALPTVRVPEFATLSELVALFKRSWLFDIQRVTDEDRLRADHYHQERERRTQAEAAADREQFLRSLDVRVSAGGLSTPAAMDRAVQLVARTNQFAYVRRDFSSADLADSGPDRRRWILTVTDRIGDYGRVGVLADRLEGDSLHVEALLLSCRVLGRGVEPCLVTLIAEDAQRLGARRVRMAVDRTERNEPLCRFVRTLGARDAGNRVVLDVPADALHDTPVSHARLVVEEASP